MSEPPTSVPAGERHRRSPLVNLLVIGLALSLLALLAAAPAAAQGAPPRFEEGPCPFALPEGFVAGQTARCGTVAVPQSRTRTDLPTLTLPVVEYALPTARRDRPPLLFLAGGPGGSGLREVADYFLASPLGQALVRERPVISFDLRGTGLAQPPLTCPEPPAASAGPAVSAAEQQARHLAAVRACRAALVEQGLLLTAFNTTESAADANDVRRALGHEQVILFGTSYGTTVALFVLRDQPAMARAAILDGVAPPQWLDGYEAAVVDAEAGAAFERYLADCAADPICSVAFPDLAGLFAALQRRGTETLPLVVADPRGGEPRRITPPLWRIDVLLRRLITNPELNGQLPLLAADALAGEPARLQQSVVGTLLAFPFGGEESPPPGQLPDMPPPIADAVLCADFPPGSPRGGRAVCDAWGVPYRGAAVSEPVSSAAPVLLLSGRYDYQTPPAWAEETARTLPNGYSYVIPAGGHVVYRRDPAAACIAVLALSFMADPTRRPVDGCVAALRPPQFLPPLPGAARPADAQAR